MKPSPTYLTEVHLDRLDERHTINLTPGISKPYMGYQLTSGGQKHSGGVPIASTLTQITRSLAQAWKARKGAKR